VVFGGGKGGLGDLPGGPLGGKPGLLAGDVSLDESL